MPADLAGKLLGVLDQLAGGIHPGFRPVHAKGMMFSGTFVPSPDASELTRAPHASRPSTPVTVRFSASAGIPTVADNAPEGSSPQGMATRFHLADHVQRKEQDDRLPRRRDVGASVEGSGEIPRARADGRGRG
jgi:catalase